MELKMTSGEVELLKACLLHTLVVEKKNNRENGEVYQFAKKKLEELKCKK